MMTIRPTDPLVVKYHNGRPARHGGSTNENHPLPRHAGLARSSSWSRAFRRCTASASSRPLLVEARELIRLALRVADRIFKQPTLPGLVRVTGVMRAAGLSPPARDPAVRAARSPEIARDTTLSTCVDAAFIPPSDALAASRDMPDHEPDSRADRTH